MNSQRATSAVAISAWTSSQATNAGLPRSPSIRMSESMSQRIVLLLVKLPNFLLDGIRCCLVLGSGLVVAEQLRRPFAAHKLAIGHQPRHCPPVLANANSFAVLDATEELMELPCQPGCRRFNHRALEYIFYTFPPTSFFPFAHVPKGER